MSRKVQGLKNYTLFRLPDIMNSTLYELDMLLGNHDDIPQVVSKLGQMTVNTIDMLRGELQYPNDFHNLSFGSWIYNSNMNYRESILNNREWNDFTQTEMMGLYSALTSSITFGCDVLTNVTHRNECKMKVAVKDIESFNLTLYVSRSDQPSYPCTLLECLQLGNEFVSSLDSVQLTIVTNCVAYHLCQNESYSCFKLPSDLTVLDAYLQAFYDYIFNHLTEYVFHKSVIIPDNGLFVSRPQLDLVRGYISGTPSLYGQEKHFIPGILEHFTNEEDVRKYTKRLTLLNCYDKTDGRRNFMWKGE